MFKILISDTIPIWEKLDDDYTFEELLEKSYKSAKDIFMEWNGFKIWIPMKYIIPEIFRDIRIMVQNILVLKKKKFNVVWPSSAFMATWECLLEGDMLTIKAYWTTIPGPSEELEKLRQQPDTIQVNLKHFLSEWYKLLLKIKEDNPQGKLREATDYWKFEEVMEELEEYLELPN